MVRVFNYSYSDFLDQNAEVLNFFDSIEYSNVHKVYPHKVFCSEKTKLCSDYMIVITSSFLWISSFA